MADNPTRKIEVNNPTRVVAGNGSVSDSVTRVVRHDESPRTVGAHRFALGALPEGATLLGTFRVIKTFRAHETARPGVFLCEDQGQKVVVKVHPLDFPPPADVWTQIGQLQHPNVVRTLRQEVCEGLYCDVQPYYDAGSLVEVYTRSDTGLMLVPTDSMQNNFAPQMLSALAYVHRNGLIHRDIKPSNILVDTSTNENTYLLGDFDISSRLSIQSDQRVTSRVAGTWTYTAPEAFPRYQDEQGIIGAKVSRASDYYSLGVAILEMACGTTPLHACKLPDMFDFYLGGQRIEVPEHLPQRLRLLIQGLLIRNAGQRWGLDQSTRWVNDQTTQADVDLIKYDSEHSPFSRIMGEPYSFGSHQARTFKQLAALFTDEPVLAVDHLQMSDALYEWIRQRDNNLALQLHRDVQSYLNHPDLALIGACLLDPETPLRFVNGVLVHSLQEWLAEADKVYKPRPEPACWLDDKQTERLLLWLQKSGAADRQIADSLSGLLSRPAPARLMEVRFAVDPKCGIELGDGVIVNHPIEFAEAAYGTEADWSTGIPECYKRAYRIWEQGILSAWFRQRGLGALSARCEELKNTMISAPYGAFETILRVVDPKLPTVQVRFERIRPVQIMFDKRTEVSVSYTTIGAGIPLLRVSCLNSTSEAFVDTPEISSREGSIRIVVTGATQLTGIPRLLDMKTAGSYTKVVGGEPTLTYEVIKNSSLALRYVGLGALSGFVCLCLPRMLMHLLQNGRQLTGMGSTAGIVLLIVLVFIVRRLYLTAKQDIQEGAS